MQTSDRLKVEGLDNVRRKEGPLNSQTCRDYGTQEIVLTISIGNFEILIDRVGFATNDLEKDHVKRVR